MPSSASKGGLAWRQAECAELLCCRGRLMATSPAVTLGHDDQGRYDGVAPHPCSLRLEDPQPLGHGVARGVVQGRQQSKVDCCFGGGMSAGGWGAGGFGWRWPCREGGLPPLRRGQVLHSPSPAGGLPPLLVLTGTTGILCIAAGTARTRRSAGGTTRTRPQAQTQSACQIPRIM